MFITKAKPRIRIVANFIFFCFDLDSHWHLQLHLALALTQISQVLITQQAALRAKKAADLAGAGVNDAN